MSRRIYLASSWRNPAQPDAVLLLRSAGHEVYDFREPNGFDTGFSWSEIDPAWLSWTTEQYVVYADPARGVVFPQWDHRTGKAATDQ